MLSLWYCIGFSLVAASGGHSLQLQYQKTSHFGGFHLLQASVVAAPELQSTGSVAVLHRLNCSVACRILLGQGLNSRLHHWQAGSLQLNPGKPQGFWILNKSEVLFHLLWHIAPYYVCDLCPGYERQWAPGAVEESPGRRGVVPILKMHLTSVLKCCFYQVVTA